MDSTVYRVYWTSTSAGVIPLFVDFTKGRMADALRFTEGLRKDQRDGKGISHVVMSCENPDSVGNPGVDVTGPEYDWKKRRV